MTVIIAIDRSYILIIYVYMISFATPFLDPSFAKQDPPCRARKDIFIVDETATTAEAMILSASGSSCLQVPCDCRFLGSSTFVAKLSSRELARAMSPKAGIGWRANVLEVSLSQVTKHQKKSLKRDGCVNDVVEAFRFQRGP